MSVVRLTADGAIGANGADGQGWSGSAATACDGRRGGDGRAGGRGGDAGLLDLELTLADGTVRFAGISSVGGQAAHTFPLGGDDAVVLAAHGGAGGVGGDAGRGEDGGRGRDGSDATRYSRGGDGGPGGRGGDAGEPADGGDAGAGGTVRLRLAEADSDLLAACAWDVGAGTPGGAGRGAAGGAGGRGGRGGSAYSWTEPYQDTETYRDSQGNTHTRSVTRHRSHRNPGGSDGPDGAHGSPSRRRAETGRPAPDGRIEITVSDSNGTRTYPGAWDLELLAVVLEPVAERLFAGDRFEPGQELRVAALTVRNRGGMPTPLTRDLEVRVEAGPGVACLAPAILTRCIAAGATVELRDTAGRLRLIDRRTPAEEPFAADEDLAFRVHVPRLARTTATRLIHRVALASPVVLERPAVYTALGIGERTAWNWTVVNRSLLPFGRTAPTPRAITTRASAPDGDAAADSLGVTRAGDALPWGDGLVDDVALLAPGGSATIAYHLAWREGARAFTGRDLAVSLAVGARDGGGPQELQLRRDRIKVAAAYRRTPEAAVLLIANHGTAAEEVEAWTAFLAALGLEANVLDLSHEGAIDLDQRLSPTQSLREEWRGRTIVALNNVFVAPSGQQSCADYLFDRQVVGAIIDDGISWYVPGDGRPLFTADALLGAGRRSRRVEQRAVDARDLAGTAVPEDSVLRLDLTQTRRFGLPATADTLAALAHGWARRLAVDHPQRRWLLIHRAAPSRESGGWWRAHWRLGTIEAHALPGLGEAGMAALPCSGERLHDLAQVRSPENRAALILALPFAEKLRLFTSLVVTLCNVDLVPERRALAEAYADAIVADLALEQEAVRRSAGTWAAWSLAGVLVEGRRVWCERWRLLCSSGFAAALPAGSERGQVLATVIGRLRALLAVFAPWWHVLLPGCRQLEITAQCRRQLDALERTAFGTGKPMFTMPDDPWTDARRNLDQARALAAAEAQRVRAALPRTGAPAERLLAAACPEVPLAVCALRRLPDRLGDGVVDGAARDAACAAQDAEDAATAARTATHRAAKDALTSIAAP